MPVVELTSSAAAFDQALVLARISPALAIYPFRRSELGHWHYDDVPHREALVRATYEIFEGETFHHTDPMPGQTLAEAQAAPGRIAINHLRHWIGVWSKSYSEEPTRTFFFKGSRLEEDDPRLEALQERYRQAQIDMLMRQTDADLRLAGNVVLRPWFDQENDELVVHGFRSHRIRVVENPLNIKRPKATVLSGERTYRAKDGRGRKARVAEIWTSEEYALVEDGVVVFREPITRPAPALVHAFDCLPTIETGYFVKAPGLELAGLASLLNNDYYSQLGYTLLMQGFGIAQIFGAQPGAKLTIGPGRVVDFSGDTDRREGIEFASPNAPLDDWRETVKFFVDTIRETYGIPKSMLDVDFAASGAAIVQANAPLAELREERMAVLRAVETDLLRSIVSVLSAHSSDFPSGVDPMDFDVSVSFVDPKVAMSVNDRIAMDKHLLDLRVLTRAQVLMREKPDEFDSEDEAEAFLAEQEQPSEGVTNAEEDQAETAPEAAPLLTSGDEPNVDAVQDTALNGAQVAALQEIVRAVSAGELPAEAAKILILKAFPTFTPEEIAAMIGSAEDFEPAGSEPQVGSTVPVAVGNPYRVEKRGDKFVVVKISDGKVVGTHDTREKAMAQFRALEANVDT